MAEPPPSGASAADGDDVVKIPKSQYMQAAAQLRHQKSQLIAASNLHRLLQDKEKEMAACKDKNGQLQLALEQTEARLSSIICRQAATASTNFPETTVLEADGAGGFFDDVVPDGEAVTPSLHCSQLSSNITKLTEKPPITTLTLNSIAVTDIPISSVVSLPLTSPSVDVSSASADMSSNDVVCIASSVTAHTLPVSSVTSAANLQSKDLLDKVLQQNARLKKILRDFLSQKGLSVSTYLVCYAAIKCAFTILGI